MSARRSGQGQGCGARLPPRPTMPATQRKPLPRRRQRRERPGQSASGGRGSRPSTRSLVLKPSLSWPRPAARLGRSAGRPPYAPTPGSPRTSRRDRCGDLAGYERPRKDGGHKAVHARAGAQGRPHGGRLARRTPQSCPPEGGRGARRSRHHTSIRIATSALRPSARGCSRPMRSRATRATCGRRPSRGLPARRRGACWRRAAVAGLGRPERPALEDPLHELRRRAAGISDFLWALSEVTNDARFRRGALAGMHWVLAQAKGGFSKPCPTCVSGDGPMIPRRSGTAGSVWARPASSGRSMHSPIEPATRPSEPTLAGAPHTYDI